MMFKVFIVDDEVIIREGLIQIIKWESYGCVVCGEACDGDEAIDLIEKLKPDIIITDIKMQRVNGLDMIRGIKEIVPNSKIIILTGFRDFDYVKDALSLGTFEFLLKPSNINDISRAIENAVKEIKEEQKTQKEFAQLRENFEVNLSALREKTLYDILFGINLDSNELASKIELYKIDIENYVLIVAESDFEESNSQTVDGNLNRQLCQIGIEKYFGEYFGDSKYEIVPLNLKRVALILYLDSDDYIGIFDKCACVQELIGNNLNLTVSIGISSVQKDILQLHKALGECERALEQKKYLGNNTLACYSDIDLSFDYQDYSLLATYRKNLLNGVKLGNVDLVTTNLKNIFEIITNSEINKELKDFYWSTISSINNIRTALITQESTKPIQDENGIGSLYSLILKCSNMLELHELLKDISIRAVERVNKYNYKSINIKVQSIIKYVDENYSKQIGLYDVSESILASTYYVSRIFKQEMGKNFVDYLNEVRMNKAKELLKDVQLKVYEVGDLVGIQDSHYFSKIFKKFTGLTPKEYRGACNIE